MNLFSNFSAGAKVVAVAVLMSSALPHAALASDPHAPFFTRMMQALSWSLTKSSMPEASRQADQTLAANRPYGGTQSDAAPQPFPMIAEKSASSRPVLPVSSYHGGPHQ